MKANFCEKGDSITYALLILFRTQKNKIDVVVMRGVVQKKVGNTVRLFIYLLWGGANSTLCSSICYHSKQIDEQKKANFGYLFVCL